VSVSSDAPPIPAGRGPFLPLLLVALAVVGWTVFQTTELVREHRSLEETHASQTTALEQAEKVRTAADSLARKTQTLADGGNASAQLIIGNLRQRGISINPSAKPLMPPP
jgi:hypothetical protein